MPQHSDGRLGAGWWPLDDSAFGSEIPPAITVHSVDPTHRLCVTERAHHRKYALIYIADFATNLTVLLLIRVDAVQLTEHRTVD